MDTWWTSRMSGQVRDNPQRSALRVAAWQQTVGHTGRSTHNVLFGEMYALLQKAAAGTDPAVFAEHVLAGMDYQQIANLVLVALADPQRSTEEIAAALRVALGDRASEVGRLLVGA
jgi:hypothetical protein